MSRREIQVIRKGFSCLSILLMCFFLSTKAHAQDEEKIIIGHKIKIQSEILEKEIHLSVHEPIHSADSPERYPVLYTFQIHFEMASGAVKNLYDYGLVPKIIIVSIENYEFGYLTPSKVESDPNSGKADLFLHFIDEELVPFINSRYQTQPYRIVFSNSWGGMFATYAILAKPDIFDAAIASIPWITYDGENRYMINHAEQFLNNRSYNNFLYMTMDNESEILPELEAFINILQKIPKHGLDWEYHYWPEDDHASASYRSIYYGLRALFEEWNQIPQDIAYRGLQAIKTHEDSLNRKFGYDIGISTSALRKSAQEQISNMNYDEAIAIYKYAIEKNPTDAFAYVSLGRAYEENGKLQLAKDAFQKAYDLAVSTAEPQVKWVKNFLDRINEKIASIKKT